MSDRRAPQDFHYAIGGEFGTVSVVAGRSIPELDGHRAREARMRSQNCIDYVEIPVSDIPRARAFLEAMFGWSFQAWGDDYLSFNDGRLNGGVRKSPEAVPATGVLLVFYSDNLERDVERVQELGGAISQEIFSFPGGRRFHFTDPTGTEFAIWSDVS